MKKGLLITGIILALVGILALIGHLKGFAGASNEGTAEFAVQIAIRVILILGGGFCIFKGIKGKKN